MVPDHSHNIPMQSVLSSPIRPVPSYFCNSHSSDIVRLVPFYIRIFEINSSKIRFPARFLITHQIILISFRRAVTLFHNARPSLSCASYTSSRSSRSSFTFRISALARSRFCCAIPIISCSFVLRPPASVPEACFSVPNVLPSCNLQNV